MIRNVNKINLVYDTVIISDLHLGSSTSQATKLLQFLKKIKFSRLILLGDVFADLNFSRLNSNHWAILSHLRKLSSEKNKIQIVWVYGNHDLGLVEVLSHLVGIEVYEKYEWLVTNKRCVAIHGHQFDPIISHWQKVSKFLSWLHLQIQKVPILQPRFSRWVDWIFSQFQNLSVVVERHAIKYAKQHGYDIICCGHTHEAMHSNRCGIDYYNSGCWVKEECTAIAFSEETISIIKVN